MQENSTSYRKSKRTQQVYSIFAGFDLMQKSIEVTSIFIIIYLLFVLLPYNLCQLPFSPLTPPLPLPPPYHATKILDCVSVPPGVMFLSLHQSDTAVTTLQRTCTGTSHRFRVGRSCHRLRKNPLPLTGGPAPRPPPPMTPLPLSLPPLPHSPSPLPQATLRSCPHIFRRSPICLPHNRHSPGRSPK